MLKDQRKILTVLFALALLLGFSLMTAPPVLAADITSAQTGNWSQTTTWVGGVVPGAFDTVTIAYGHTVTVDVAASCASLTLASGAQPTNTRVSISGSNSLTVSGAITTNRDRRRQR